MRLLIRLLMWLSYGYGKAVPLLFVAVVMGTIYIMQKVSPGLDMNTGVKYIFGAIVFLFSVPIWFWGRSLNRDTHDPHNFILINMEYWAFLGPGLFLSLIYLLHQA